MGCWEEVKEGVVIGRCVMVVIMGEGREEAKIGFVYVTWL